MTQPWERQVKWLWSDKVRIQTSLVRVGGKKKRGNFTRENTTFYIWVQQNLSSKYTMGAPEVGLWGPRGLIFHRLHVNQECGAQKRHCPRTKQGTQLISTPHSSWMSSVGHGPRDYQVGNVQGMSPRGTESRDGAVGDEAGTISLEQKGEFRYLKSP